LLVAVVAVVAALVAEAALEAYWLVQVLFPLLQVIP
jgi:hypothetical protein